MELDLRHHPPGHRPTRCLIEKTFESKHRLLAWPSYWPRQQLPNVPLQAVVGGKADRVLHVPFFQRLVELRLAKRCVAAEDHLLAQRLLPLNLGQQQFLPAVGAVDITGAQLGGQAVALAVEQQQRMIAGGLEVAVVGTLLLPAGLRCCPYRVLPVAVKRWPLPWRPTLG